MTWRRRVVLALRLGAGFATTALSACGSQSPPEESDGSTSSAADASTGSAQTTATPPTGTSSTTATPTGTDPAGTADPATSTDPTTPATDSTTTGETSTGETGESTGMRATCGDKGTDGPYFRLTHQDDELLETEQSFVLDCGFQGAFMFEFGVVLGGVDLGGELFDLSLTFDVEGFNVGPSGYFYAEDIDDLLVECEDGIGVSALRRVIIITPDELADVTTLDGATVEFSITTTTDDGTVTPFVSQGTVSAVPSEDWDFCGG